MSDDPTVTISAASAAAFAYRRVRIDRLIVEAGLAPSLSAAMRLHKQGAVSIREPWMEAAERRDVWGFGANIAVVPVGTPFVLRVGRKAKEVTIV